MQAHKFSNGGFVAHKLRVPHLSPMKFSAWYSIGGSLLDCEAFDKAGRSRPVPAKVRQVLADQFGLVAIACRATNV